MISAMIGLEGLSHKTALEIAIFSLQGAVKGRQFHPNNKDKAIVFAELYFKTRIAGFSEIYARVFPNQIITQKTKRGVADLSARHVEILVDSFQQEFAFKTEDTDPPETNRQTHYL